MGQSEIYSQKKALAGCGSNLFFFSDSGDPYKLAWTFCGREKSSVDVKPLESCLRASQTTWSCSG